MILENNLRKYINNISILIKLYVLVNLFVSNIKKFKPELASKLDYCWNIIKEENIQILVKI